MTTTALLALSNKPRFTSSPSFKRCSLLLDLLSINPSKIKSIGITGSNGKGSTAFMLSAILTGHGLKTGLFTSPHFLNPTERFRINQDEISEQRLEEITSKVLIASTKIEKQTSEEFSRFELLTVMAFEYFNEENVDVLVLEAGIGGRLDPTKLAKPSLTGITSLELEHAEILGDTIPKIFTEKIQLLESGGLCIASIDSKDSFMESYKQIANDKGVTLRTLEEVYEEVKYNQTSIGTCIEVDSQKISIPLVGNWQGKNALLALTLAKEVISKDEFSLATSEEALSKVVIPGRFEKIANNPSIILDAGHTPNAMKEVVNYIIAQDDVELEKSVILLGISKNKQVNEMLKELSKLNLPFFISSAKKGGESPSILSKELALFGKTILAEGYSLCEILEKAKLFASKNAGSVFVIGGLFFAADVQRIENGISLENSIYL